MPALAFIYGQLHGLPDPSVDQALVAAIPSADPPALKLIISTLLKRQERSGLMGLIAHYHLLPEDLQVIVANSAQTLYREMRSAATHRRGNTAADPDQSAMNVVDMVRRTRSPALAYLIVEQLRHGPADLRRQAGACLRDLAEHAAQQLEDPWTLESREQATARGADAVNVGYLLMAVDEAVETYSLHAQPAVLLAMAALIPRPMPRARRALADPRHFAVGPTRHLLSRPTQPAVRRMLLAALAIHTLRDSALAGLARLATIEELGQVLEQAHLLRIPAVATSLGRAVEMSPLLEINPGIEDLAPHQARGLPALFTALPLPIHEKTQRLARLLQWPDPLTRLAVVRRLLALCKETHGAYDALAVACSDRDEQIARLALHGLLRARWTGLPKLLPRLINSPHISVRHLAGAHLAPLAFTRLWESWPRLGAAQRLAAGRAMIKIDPTFHKQLGAHLQHPDRDSRLRALAIIYELNQGALFEPALISLTTSTDDMVAASAVRALGSGQSELALAVLERALHHHDGRVRANAVESLEQLNSHKHVRHLVQMAQADQARPRANAIHSLMRMRTADALSALSGMLSDTRPEHRASALWVVENLGLLDLARHVAEMSLSDTDRTIKRRAGHVIQHLIELFGQHPTEENVPSSEAKVPS